VRSCLGKNSRAILPPSLGALLESSVGAGLPQGALDAPGILIYRRGLKFFWKLTIAVTKMAKLSPLLPPGIQWDRSDSLGKF
jgi:hypothetical protein